MKPREWAWHTRLGFVVARKICAARRHSRPLRVKLTMSGLADRSDGTMVFSTRSAAKPREFHRCGTAHHGLGFGLRTLLYHAVTDALRTSKGSSQRLRVSDNTIALRKT